VQPKQNLGPLTLRFDGVFLALAGGVAMIAETMGHFFGVGPFASAQGSPHTIGGFEAHGFAVLIGVLLFRAAALAERQLWHRIGFSAHLFLSVANLLFWSAFVQQSMVPVSPQPCTWPSFLHIRSACEVVRLAPNPSLHPTFNSRLRRLLPAGELKR
jgi:hypothetical protein